jgi:hypothetical protein
MTDGLSLANALAEAKIDRSTAERIATEIYDAIQYNVATKTDLELLKTDLELVKRELKTDIALVKTELQLLEHRLMMRLGSLMVVLPGLLFAALRYLPPAH